MWIAQFHASTSADNVLESLTRKIMKSLKTNIYKFTISFEWTSNYETLNEFTTRYKQLKT